MTVPSAAAPSRIRPGDPTRVRYLVVLLLGLAAFCAYLTRVCISTAATTIQSELGLSNERMGSVFAAFSLGYFLFQAPGGWLGNRFGCRAALPALSVAWSLCTLWSGAAHSVGSLWSARLGFGLAQAGLVPCCSKVLADWIPESGRGTASALVASSMSVGAVLASGLTAWLLPAAGWRPVFALYSLAGVVWAILFFAVFRDRPEEHPWVNASEAGLIEAGRPPHEVRADGAAPADRRTGLAVARAMLRSPSLWAICSQSLFRSFGYAFFITWFPAYLQYAHALRVTEAGMLTMIPLAGVVAGSLAGGVIVDRIMRRTGSKRLSRSGTATAAMVLCGAATLAAAWARSPLGAVLVISFGSFFMGVSGPCAWAGTMDISGRYTAIVFALMNMAGVVGDMTSPVAVGYLFSYVQQSAGDWNWILFLFAGIYGAAALSWAVLDPSRPAAGSEVTPS
ncbi:MAG TPA: MFS transporter [Bryobacteraceae bacterium]|nr:MFS transporter [Bryobacteraceae bacterium]